MHNHNFFSTSTHKNSTKNLSKENEQHILELLKKETTSLDKLSSDALLSAIKEATNKLILMRKIQFSERQNYIDKIYNELCGLGVLQPLLNDKEITEIMVNGSQEIFVEKKGKLFKIPEHFQDEKDLQDKIQRIFSQNNKRIDLLSPIADTHLADGSRVNAVLAPLSPSGSLLTIRKFCGIKPSQEALLENQSISQEMLDFLKNCVLEKKSLFLCGGTGSGKTTLLNILANFIPKDERIICIEDSVELSLPKDAHWISLEARQSTSEGLGEINMEQLIKTALRMRPNRLIVGEVRGKEALQLLHATNTGHPGSLCTGHANSCEDMIRRLANLVLEHSRLPYAVVLKNIASAFPFFVYLEREKNGQRKVKQIVQISKVEENEFYLNTIFEEMPQKISEKNLAFLEEQRKPKELQKRTNLLDQNKLMLKKERAYKKKTKKASVSSFKNTEKPLDEAWNDALKEKFFLNPSS